MPSAPSETSKLAVVFGGTGFIGRHVVRALARRGWRVRVAARRPDLAGFLQPLGGVGQIQFVQANLRYPSSIRAALRGADSAVNATGILSQLGAQNFEAAHVFGPREIARAAKAEGLAALVHVSGLGADPSSASAYVASKGRGAAALRESFPEATILEPSVVFGAEDDFLTRIAALARFLPVLPLFGGGLSRIQPVFAGDVGRAAAIALDAVGAKGVSYELGGPEVMTLREAMEFTLRAIGRHRALLPLPFAASLAMARATEIAGVLTLGLFPKILTTTRDQIELLRHDNVVSDAAVAQRRTLADLGVEPQGLEALAPAFLARFCRTGQFAANLPR